MHAFGEWIFNPATRRLCGRRGERKLSPKATAVLQALAETPGQVWSRDALLERIWPNVIVGEEVLTHAIAELRRAAGDDFRSPALIETIHKSGYRLLTRPDLQAPVRTEPGPIDAAQADAPRELECYAMYLEGAALFERGHKSNTRAAADRFREILAIAPDFAPAHAGLGKALTFLKTYYDPNGGDLEQALVHCRIAQRFDPQLAEAYAVEGLILAISGKFDLAQLQFSRAIRLNADSGEDSLFVRARLSG